MWRSAVYDCVTADGGHPAGPFKAAGFRIPAENRASETVAEQPSTKSTDSYRPVRSIMIDASIGPRARATNAGAISAPFTAA